SQVWRQTRPPGGRRLLRRHIKEKLTVTAGAPAVGACTGLVGQGDASSWLPLPFKLCGTDTPACPEPRRVCALGFLFSANSVSSAASALVLLFVSGSLISNRRYPFFSQFMRE